jgi:D-arabinose 1-dehydrogenase-like Zn-dependent alcohol dehydrogenase
MHSPRHTRASRQRRRFQRREMFQFSPKHGIMPMTKIYAMSEVNKALAPLRHNLVRYRTVLVYGN